MESLVGTGHQKIMGLINVTSSPILQSHLLGLNSMRMNSLQELEKEVKSRSELLLQEREGGSLCPMIKLIFRH